MPSLIDEPARIAAEGNNPKLIEEYIGYVSSGTDAVSIARAGEWVQYSTPELEGAVYVAVCLPAFSPQIVHRER